MSEFGNVPPFYVRSTFGSNVSALPAAGSAVLTDKVVNVTAGGVVQTETLSQVMTLFGANLNTFTGGAIGSGWTFTKDAEASVAEAILTLATSDAGGAKLTLGNSSTTDSTMVPAITGTSLSTNICIDFRAVWTTDSGSNPLYRFSNGSTNIGVRPYLTMQQNGSLIWSVGPKGKFAITPSASSTAAASSASTFSATVAADTARTAATEATQFLFDGSATQTWANGTTTVQRNALFKAPTNNGTSGTSTVFTTAATVAIDAAPSDGANTSAGTNRYSLWCQTGKAQFDGGIGLGLRADLKSYTVATLPAAGVAGGIIYVSDAGGNGPCLAVSNGTNWKRCDNVSTTVV